MSGTESATVDDSTKPRRITPEEWFSLFVDTTSCSEALEIFDIIKNILGIQANEKVYEKIKTKLTSWKCQSIWDLIDAKAKHVEYGKGAICSHLNVLIIGAGPIGLRTAIETALLGCRTVIVEKRTEFTRNNVLHLWPFLLSDFKSLGAKKLYGKFCAGAIDHISIRKLQSILLKVCLILGVEVHTGIEFKNLIEPTNEHGWKVQLSPYKECLDKLELDIVIGADGKKDMLPGFPQIEMRGALAIGITCNFVNENSMAEAGVEEISGVAYQYNPKFFEDLNEKFGVRLENIVYYKDETHYFVMTALKTSLLSQGVFRKDFSEPSKLLEKQNVDMEKLIEFTLNTVHYATDYKLPSDIKLVENSNGTPDIAVFDFTSIKKSASASRIVERNGRRLLLALVGDSLLEPFWPTGSGCGRGVLSALDAAWMIRLFGMKMPPLAVLRERENVFKLLSGTDPRDLQKNHKAFTINPTTRYSNLNQVQSVNASYLKKLYDIDDPERADYTLPQQVAPAQFEIGRSLTMPPPKSRRKSILKRRLHSTSSNKRRSDRTTLREAKHVSKTMAMWEGKIPKQLPGVPSKRTKPSQSGSGASGLESVSESEEEAAPYQRALVLRKRAQNSEDQVEVYTASSAEEIDVFEDESQQLLDKLPCASVQGSSDVCNEVTMPAAKADAKKMHKFGTFRRLLGKGRGDHDVERRKSIAARKSISKARRMRRKSGATGSQSSQSQPESEVKTTQGYNASVVGHKRRVKEKKSHDQDQLKVPSDRPLSAKELIAAAEDRDKQQHAIAVSSAKADSLKRKADDVMADELKTSSYDNLPWIHYIPAVEPLLPKENQRKDGTHTVMEASQLTGLLLLAVPLLLPCRVRLVGKHSEMLAEKRNTLLRCSTEKRETRKISLTRAGSVLRAVEQFQNKQETSTNENFKRNRFSGSFKRDSLQCNGKGSVEQTQSMGQSGVAKAESSVNTDEYEIIEMRGAAQRPKECLQNEDEFEVISCSEVKVDGLDSFEEQKMRKMTKKKTIKLKPGEIMRDLLSQLCRNHRLTSVQITLDMLHGMHMSISKNPGQEKFYRIYTKGRDFETYVWSKNTCRDFLKQVGWQVCGNFIVLSKSQSVKEPLKCIEAANRDVERLLLNESHSSKERASAASECSSTPNGGLNDKSIAVNDGKIDVGKSPLLLNPANNLQNSVGREDLSFQPNKGYVDYDESSDCSDNADDTLESSEGYIGDEKYLIVDFANKEQKEGPAISTVGKLEKMEEDAVYGKDGRRRRRKRQEEKSDVSSEEAVQTERVPLRSRLRERNMNNAPEPVSQNTGRRRAQGTGEEAPNQADNVKATRRSSTERSSGDPPAQTSTIRRAEQRRLAARGDDACKTTTTSLIAADRPCGRSDEARKRPHKETKDYIDIQHLLPVDSMMTGEDTSQEISQTLILSRLEELRHESSGDSSGNESGKRKKLVLKRGSMRRKKQAEGSCSSELSGASSIKGQSVVSDLVDGKESKEPVESKENNIESNFKTSVGEARAKFPESREIEEANIEMDNHEKGTAMAGNKPVESMEGNIKSRIANLLASFNNEDLNQGKDRETVANSTTNNKTEISNSNSRTVIAIKEKHVNKGEEPKKEKKRKLVLKVKRKKNINQQINGSCKETIETSPVEPRDLNDVISVRTKEGEMDAMGEVGVSESGKDTRTGVEEVCRVEEDRAGQGVLVQKSARVSENGCSRYEQLGLTEEVNTDKDERSQENPAFSEARTDKVDTSEKEEENVRVENEQDETEKESKLKKKKFVLKRKKKVDS